MRVVAIARVQCLPKGKGSAARSHEVNKIQLSPEKMGALTLRTMLPYRALRVSMGQAWMASSIRSGRLGVASGGRECQEGRRGPCECEPCLHTSSCAGVGHLTRAPTHSHKDIRCRRTSHTRHVTFGEGAGVEKELGAPPSLLPQLDAQRLPRPDRHGLRGMKGGSTSSLHAGVQLCKVWRTVLPSAE